jgi:hypothetical protein
MGVRGRRVPGEQSATRNLPHTSTLQEEFASGSLLLEMDGRGTTQVAVQNGQASLSVPEGEHGVRLEKR